MDQARLRTIVTAAHADDDLDRALEAFATVGRELDLGVKRAPGGARWFRGRAGDRSPGAQPSARRAPSQHLSPDSDVQIDAYAEQALERGIDELAITDHVDFEPGRRRTARRRCGRARGGRSRRRRSLGAARRRDPVRRGAHLRPPLRGGPARPPAAARVRLRDRVGPRLPFIAVRQRPRGGVRRRQAAGVIVAPYFDEVEAAARSGLFDALGHRLREAVSASPRDACATGGCAGALRADPAR